jgi:phasin family protein
MHSNLSHKPLAIALSSFIFYFKHHLDRTHYVVDNCICCTAAFCHEPLWSDAMSEKSSSFNPFDMSKVLTEFDPSKMMEQFNKVVSDYKIPGVDMSAIVELQRKNVEALTSANRQAIEGLQAVANRQSEILKETMDEAVTALRELSSAGGPKEATTKQAELLSKSFEKALTNMRELAEMAAKSNTDAFNVIQQRIHESVNEIKSLARNMGAEKT